MPISAPHQALWSSTFAHRATWNARESRVEMHLVARSAQQVHIDAAQLDFRMKRGEPIWIVTLLNRSSRPVGTIYIGATRGIVKRTEGMFAGATMEDVENDYDDEEGTGVFSDVKKTIKHAFHRTQDEARGMFDRVKRSFSDFINRE